MTARRPTINVMEHPAGYLTDFDPHQTEMKPDADDISILLINIPAAANVTFRIKLLNLTASHQSLFTINTALYSAMNIAETQSRTNTTLHLFPPSEAEIHIKYRARDRQIIGEFLHIVYTGKSFESQKLFYRYYIPSY